MIIDHLKLAIGDQKKYAIGSGVEIRAKLVLLEIRKSKNMRTNRENNTLESDKLQILVKEKHVVNSQQVSLISLWAKIKCKIQGKIDKNVEKKKQIELNLTTLHLQQFARKWTIFPHFMAI